MNLQAQKSIVFVGSYNYDKNKDGIYVYELDTKTGVLNKLSSVKNILNPSYLALSANGKYLYACSETQTPNAGSISGFAFDPKKKALSFINSQKSGGDNPAYVSLHKNGKWIVNANYSGGSVGVHPLAADGSIKQGAQVIKYADSSIFKERQNQSHIHSTVFSPDYRYIFLPDLGADKIRIYKFNELKDQPLQAAQIPFVKTVAGSGPRHFTFHPNGKFAYCIEELSGTIDVFKYANGKLDKMQRIKTHTDQFKANFGSADIHISPDGKFLYASNRGVENNIAIFSIKNDGKLMNVGYQSTLGNHPRNFSIDATGKFLIAANMNSGDIVVFKRNSKTGLLTKVGKETKVANPSCIVIRKYE
jgi:6-phosphogluconolactonase (cycloisomerase 2 family)